MSFYGGNEMANTDYPVLCGGTFFVLILEAHGARTGKKEQLYGKKDSLSAPSTLAALVKIMYPAYELPSDDKTAGTITSGYRYCKNEGVNLSFLNTGDVDLFDRRVKSNYWDVLREMSAFVDGFLDTELNGGKDERLVCQLLDLIEQDVSIKDSEEFYI
jgi:putative hemolysin